MLQIKIAGDRREFLADMVYPEALAKLPTRTHLYLNPQSHIGLCEIVYNSFYLLVQNEKGESEFWRMSSEILGPEDDDHLGNKRILVDGIELTLYHDGRNYSLFDVPLPEKLRSNIELITEPDFDFIFNNKYYWDSETKSLYRCEHLPFIFKKITLFRKGDPISGEDYYRSHYELSEHHSTYSNNLSLTLLPKTYYEMSPYDLQIKNASVFCTDEEVWLDFSEAYYKDNIPVNISIFSALMCNAYHIR